MYALCSRGHLLDPPNVYTRPSGKKNCRACQDNARQAYADRKQQKEDTLIAAMALDTPRQGPSDTVRTKKILIALASRANERGWVRSDDPSKPTNVVRDVARETKVPADIIEQALVHFREKGWANFRAIHLSGGKTQLNNIRILRRGLDAALIPSLDHIAKPAAAVKAPKVEEAPAPKPKRTYRRRKARAEVAKGKGIDPQDQPQEVASAFEGIYQSGAGEMVPARGVLTPQEDESPQDYLAELERSRIGNSAEEAIAEEVIEAAIAVHGALSEEPEQFPLISALVNRRDNIRRIAFELDRLGLVDDATNVLAKEDDLSPLETEILRFLSVRGIVLL